MQTCKYFLIIMLLLLVKHNLHAQENNQNLVLKNLDSGKEKVVAPHSKFKAKLTSKKKIKGRLAEVSDSFFVSEQNDTIYFNQLRWLKAKKKLTKRERGAGIAGFFAGLYFSPVVLTASTMVYMMERTTPGNPAIFLLNAIPIGVTVISIRTLAGRRYKTKNWELHTQPAEVKTPD